MVKKAVISINEDYINQSEKRINYQNCRYILYQNTDFKRHDVLVIRLTEKAHTVKNNPWVYLS